jgi:hypothetical protein
MPTLTRRGLLILGGTGAAGVALAGCSKAEEPRDEADAEELTAAEAEAEGNLAGAYKLAASAVPTGEERATLERFTAASTKRAAEISGGSFENTSPPPDGGPDFPEALSACQHLADDAIAAHLQAARLLDEVDGRALASSSLAACAAELAVVNGFARDPVAPNAFVTGGPAPLEDSDSPDSGGETSTTTSSSTSSSSTTDTTADQ